MTLTVKIEAFVSSTEEDSERSRIQKLVNLHRLTEVLIMMEQNNQIKISEFQFYQD